MKFLVALINNSLQPARRAEGEAMPFDASPVSVEAPAPTDENPAALQQAFVTTDVNPAISEKMTSPDDGEASISASLYADPTQAYLAENGFLKTDIRGQNGQNGQDSSEEVDNTKTTNDPGNTPVYSWAGEAGEKASVSDDKVDATEQQASQSILKQQYIASIDSKAGNVQGGTVPGQTSWITTRQAAGISGKNTTTRDKQTDPDPDPIQRTTAQSDIPTQKMGETHTIEDNLSQGDRDPLENNQLPQPAPVTDYKPTAAASSQPPFPLKQEPQSRTIKTEPKLADIPQVRIGHIDVLIDDRSAVKSGSKSSPPTTRSSNPFGLRGL